MTCNPCEIAKIKRKRLDSIIDVTDALGGFRIDIEEAILQLRNIENEYRQQRDKYQVQPSVADSAVGSDGVLIRPAHNLLGKSRRTTHFIGVPSSQPD